MKCNKLLKGNKPCRAWAQKETQLCFRHDPNKREQGLLSSQKGGQNRALQGFYGTAIKLESPDDIKRFLGQVINAVWSEGVPVPVGSAMGFLTRCWLDAYEASVIVKRLEQIEDKISNL